MLPGHTVIPFEWLVGFEKGVFVTLTPISGQEREKKKKEKLKVQTPHRSADASTVKQKKQKYKRDWLGTREVNPQ